MLLLLCMGVAKGWRFSGGVLVWANHNLAVLHNNNDKQQQQCVSLSLSSPAPVNRRQIRWSLVCGVLLFVFGLISLFTGHVASYIEWYSHRLVKRSWYYKLVIDFYSFFLIIFIAIYLLIIIDFELGLSVCKISLIISGSLLKRARACVLSYIVSVVLFLCLMFVL